MKKEAFSIKIKTPLVRFLIYLYLLEFYMDLLLMSYIETYVLHVTVSGMSNLKQNFVLNFLAIHNVKVRQLLFSVQIKCITMKIWTSNAIAVYFISLLCFL